MPPVKPLPSLHELSLNSFARSFLISYVSRYLSPDEINGRLPRLYSIHSDVRSPFVQDSHLSVERCRQYFEESLIVSIRNRLLDVLLKEILQNECFFFHEMGLGHNMDYNYLDKLMKITWTLLGDVLRIFASEGIDKVDFSHIPKGDSSFMEFDDRYLIDECSLTDFSWPRTLVILKLPDVWNADVIENIGFCCSNLQYLDISHTTITLQYNESQCIERFCFLYGVKNVRPKSPYFQSELKGCPKLTTIVFPDWIFFSSKMLPHAVEMIKFMPNLNVVNNIDTRSIALGFMKKNGYLCNVKFTECEEREYRFSLKENKTFDDNLRMAFQEVTRYATWCGEDFNNQVLQRIQYEFPFVQVIEINYPISEILLDRHLLNVMPSVRIFKIYDVENNVGWNEIKALNTAFPNLQELVMNCNCFVNEIGQDNNLNVNFSKLQSLEIRKIYELDVDYLKAFLERAPSLKKLVVRCVQPSLLFLGEREVLTDDFVQTLSSSMTNLEEVTFRHDGDSNKEDFKSFLPLSFRSVQALMTCCHNLKYLGELSHWSIYHEEYQRLIDEKKKHNWDIDFGSSVNHFLECMEIWPKAFTC